VAAAELSRLPPSLGDEGIGGSHSQIMSASSTSSKNRLATAVFTGLSERVLWLHLTTCSGWSMRLVWPTSVLFGQGTVCQDIHR
jgi:hypothetical protein